MARCPYLDYESTGALYSQGNYICKLCGEVKMTIADKASHTKSDYYIIETDYHAKECTVCLKILEKEDHYYYDDVCIVCGKTHDSSLNPADTTK